MTVKYVKEFSFGGKVNCAKPRGKDYSLGGRVSDSLDPIAADKVGLAKQMIARDAPHPKYADGGKVKAGLDYIQSAKPGEKSKIAGGVADYFKPDDKPGMIGRAAQAVKDKAIEKSPLLMKALGVTNDADEDGMAKGGPVTRHQQMATAGLAGGGSIMSRGNLPQQKGTAQDPSIKAFKKPSRRGKA